MPLPPDVQKAADLLVSMGEPPKFTLESVIDAQRNRSPTELAAMKIFYDQHGCKCETWDLSKISTLLEPTEDTLHVQCRQCQGHLEVTGEAIRSYML